MKDLLSILALILIVAGFAVIVMGYSPNTPPTDTDNNNTLPDESPPEYPHYPENPPGWHYQNIPHEPEPMDLYGLQITYTEFIGILLIVAGVILLALGGKQ